MGDVVTESEASKRWCPFVRVLERVDPGFHKEGAKVSQIVIAVNRSDSDEIKNRCLGSQCMAWHSVPSASPVGETKGYCGAFGKPAGA